MKKEIVYTDEYALILSDERIEDVRPHKDKFHLEQGSIINQFPTYLTDLTECKLIIAHLPLSDAPMLEGVTLLPPLPQGDDIEGLAKESVPDGFRTIWKNGYNKAKEKYKYTEADLEIAMNWLFETKGRKGLEDLIERLNQPSRPTHFELEHDDEFDDDRFVPLIKRNSQGQIELVGKYI